MIEIQHEHAPSELAHRDGEVCRDRRLADAAFEIHERQNRRAALAQWHERRGAPLGNRFPDPSVPGLDPLENRFQRAGASLHFLKAVMPVTSLLVVLPKLDLELLAFRSQIAKSLGLSLLPADQLEQPGLESICMLLNVAQLVPVLLFFRGQAIDVLQQPLDFGVPARITQNP